MSVLITKLAPAATAREALTWPARIANYHATIKRPAYMAVEDDGWVYGYWVLGYYARTKDARACDFHGAYPGDYLRRVRALFPDKKRILHVFSGMVDTSAKGLPGDTLDIRPKLNPTYCANAEAMQYVPLEQYDLVLADPPYSSKDAGQYGTRMVVPGRVMSVLERLLSGAHVVWLDERRPGFRKDAWHWEAVIGLTTSGGHRVRQITIFRRR